VIKNLCLQLRESRCRANKSDISRAEYWSNKWIWTRLIVHSFLYKWTSDSTVCSIIIIKSHDWHWSKDKLFRIVKKLDSQDHQHCMKEMQCHKKEYIVSKSNYLWSIDDHNKLQAWGIEIYADIDAFSHYVSWIYVNTTNHIKISVTRQYLQTV